MLKNCKNYEYEPLITHNKNTPILYVIPPPPLHLISLGPVNDMINNFKKILSKTVQYFILFTYSTVQISQPKFEGNQCHKILKFVSRLDIPDNLVELKNVLLGNGAIKNPWNMLCYGNMKK